MQRSRASERLSHVTLPVTAFVASRVAVFITAQAVGWLNPEIGLRQALTAWDGGWYLRIAANGYPTNLDMDPGTGGSRWGFAPLYPLLIRVTAEVTGMTLAASSVILSLIAGAVTMCLIHTLISEVLGPSAADAAVIVLCFHPAAYVLGMAYTESVFLLCASGALLAIQRGRLVTAGALASASCLIRTPGLAVVAAVLVAAASLWHRGERARAVAAALTSVIGSLLWIGFQWTRAGTPRAQQLVIERYWFSKFIWFTRPIRSSWFLMTSDERWTRGAEFLSALAFALIVACYIALYVRWRRGERRLPLEWHVYSVISLLMAASAYWPMSILRYSMAAFPLIAVGISEVPPRYRGVVYGVGGALMCTFAAVAYLGLYITTPPFAP